jgi:probable rRNA maturation factor
MTGKSELMELEFENADSVEAKEKDLMEKAAALALKKEDIPSENCVLSVSFVSPEEIHELNRDYRDVDRTTDVLSFPQFETPEEIAEMCGQPFPVEIGDVVINLDQVRKQAEEFGHSYERELIYLFVHSVLHLLGYDHIEENDRKVMRAREEEILGEMGIERDAAPWTDHSEDHEE